MGTCTCREGCRDRHQTLPGFAAAFLAVFADFFAKISMQYLTPPSLFSMDTLCDLFFNQSSSSSSFLDFWNSSPNDSLLLTVRNGDSVVYHVNCRHGDSAVYYTSWNGDSAVYLTPLSKCKRVFCSISKTI